MRLALAPIVLLALAAAGCATPAARPRRAHRDAALAPHEQAVFRHLTPRAVAALDDSPLVVRDLRPTRSTRHALHRAEYDAATRERRIGTHVMERDDVVVERAVLHESIHHLRHTTDLIDAAAFERALDEPYNAGLAFRLDAVMTTYGASAQRTPEERIAFAAELIAYFEKDVSDAMHAVFAQVLVEPGTSPTRRP